MIVLAQVWEEPPVICWTLQQRWIVGVVFGAAVSVLVTGALVRFVTKGWRGRTVWTLLGSLLGIVPAFFVYLVGLVTWNAYRPAYCD
ncbi:MAG: hypothetical protein AAF416_20040 [Pseudomonadota bacterium]